MEHRDRPLKVFLNRLAAGDGKLHRSELAAGRAVLMTLIGERQAKRNDAQENNYPKAKQVCHTSPQWSEFSPAGGGRQRGEGGLQIETGADNYRCARWAANLA